MCACASTDGTADSHALTAHAPGAGANGAGGGGARGGTDSVAVAAVGSSAEVVGGTYICVNVENGAAVAADDAGAFPRAAPRRPSAPANTGAAFAAGADSDEIADVVAVAAKSPLPFPADGCVVDEDAATAAAFTGGGAFDGGAASVEGSSSAKTQRPSFSSK